MLWWQMQLLSKISAVMPGNNLTNAACLVLVKPYQASLCTAWNILEEINSSPPGQNGCHFTDDIFKCIFINEKFCISIWILLKSVPSGQIDNKSALVQVMAWHRTADKPLPEPILTQFNSPMHICGTRWRWINTMPADVLAPCVARSSVDMMLMI